MAFTYSILISLFIKNFSPTSSAKYCFRPRVFSHLQEGFFDKGGRLERRTFCLVNGERGTWKISRLFGFMRFSFVNMLSFWLSAFAY